MNPCFSLVSVVFDFVIDLRNRYIYEPGTKYCEIGDEKVTMRRNQWEETDFIRVRLIRTFSQNLITTITQDQSCLKDIRANCFCASLLGTQIHTPRHVLSACAKY